MSIAAAHTKLDTLTIPARGASCGDASPEDQDRLLKPGTVAAQLKVSERTVRAWIGQGTLPAIRVTPKTIRVRLSALEDLLRAGETTTRNYAK